MNIIKLFIKSHYNHKFLGTLSLINYSYRFYLWYNYNDFFIKNDIFNICFIFIDILLGLSSFTFELPTNRIKNIPIIWSETRLNTIIYAHRSIFIIYIFFLYWYTHNEIFNYLRGIIVILTMICVDNVRDYYILCNILLGKNNNIFFDKNNNIFQKIQYPVYTTINTFYDISYIYSTMNCIFAKNIDMIYILLFNIQISMFLMTLLKKNIISINIWHLLYSSTLLMNYIIPLYAQNGIFDIYEKILFIFLLIICCILRLKYNYNKYNLYLSIIFIHWILLYNFNKFNIPLLL
jgi:hypothetical protein